MSPKKSEPSESEKTKVTDADMKISGKRPRTSLYRAPDATTPSQPVQRTEKTSHCPDNWGSE